MVWLFHNKIFKICFKVIKTIFLLFLFIYCSFILLEKVTYHTNIFGYRLYSVSSNSMKKVYHLYDVVLVKKTKISSLKVGADIAYIGERGGLKGKVVLHRIVKIEKTEKEKLYYTKGVSYPTIDPSIKGSKIIGKIEGKIYFISEINHIAKTQVGFFFLIFCPLVLLILLEILKTITDIKVEKGKLQETDRLSLTEVIKIRNRTKGKKNLETTYHDIPLIVESLSIDESEKDIDIKSNEKEKKKFSIKKKSSKNDKKEDTSKEKEKKEEKSLEKKEEEEPKKEEPLNEKKEKKEEKKDNSDEIEILVDEDDLVEDK